jgi:hypothetical protein
LVRRLSGSAASEAELLSGYPAPFFCELQKFWSRCPSEKVVFLLEEEKKLTDEPM